MDEETMIPGNEIPQDDPAGTLAPGTQEAADDELDATAENVAFAGEETPAVQAEPGTDGPAQSATHGEPIDEQE